MRTFRNRNFAILDILLLGLSAYLSFVIRLERLQLAPLVPAWLIFTGLVIVICPLVLWRAGVYRRFWRYASLDEGLLLAGAMTTATVLVSAASLFFHMTVGPAIPRSVPFIFLLLGLVATAGPRYLYRLISRTRRRNALTLGGPSESATRCVLVMGAGDAGAMVVREMLDHPQLGMEPTAFVDDDRSKIGMRIHGILVAGVRTDIPRLARTHNVHQVIIALPAASGQAIREVVEICAAAGIETKIVPGISEILNGRVSVRQLREVRIEDLLRREPVVGDVSQVAELLRGRRVLVTGAGGSIGSELCRQIIRFEPAELILLGHGENSVFEILGELESVAIRQRCAACRLRPQIIDVRDLGRLNAAFEACRPEIVFHAAAHKHVPLMEADPIEAVGNNVLGTRNVLSASEAVGVERFVLISTDKAVNPTSVMGATKRVAERLVRQSAQRSGKPYCAVRFGNVLGSRGSVVLTFRRQIAAGGPVTVTDPEIKRFFMTIPEAVHLVMQAAAMGKGGELFVLDMGKLVRIVDLAKDMIRLSGLEPDRDIKIVFTGLRPGEKLYEELFIGDESHDHTAHEKVFIVHHPEGGASDDDCLDESVQALQDAIKREDAVSLLQALRRAVPEYQ